MEERKELLLHHILCLLFSWVTLLSSMNLSSSWQGALLRRTVTCLLRVVLFLSISFHLNHVYLLSETSVSCFSCFCFTDYSSLAWCTNRWILSFNDKISLSCTHIQVALSFNESVSYPAPLPSCEERCGKRAQVSLMMMWCRLNLTESSVQFSYSPFSCVFFTEKSDVSVKKWWWRSWWYSPSNNSTQL